MEFMFYFYIFALVLLLAAGIFFFFSFKGLNKKRNRVKVGSNWLSIEEMDKRIEERIKAEDLESAEKMVEKVFNVFELGPTDPRSYHYNNIKFIIYKYKKSEGNQKIENQKKALEYLRANLDHPLQLINPHKRIDLEEEIALMETSIEEMENSEGSS